MRGPVWDEAALASLDKPTAEAPTPQPVTEDAWTQIVTIVAGKLPFSSAGVRGAWALEIIEDLNRGGFSIVATCPPLPDRP